MRLPFLLILILAANLNALSAAPQRIRLTTTIYRPQPDQFREEEWVRSPLASPIAEVENGRPSQLFLLDLPIALIATLDGESSALVGASVGPGSGSAVIKLGEKGTIAAGPYRIQVIPQLMKSGVNLAFAGGDLAQLLKQLREDRDLAFSVVTGDVLMTTEVPSFTVRNASVPDFAAALDLLLSSKGVHVQAVAKEPSSDPIVVFNSTTYNAAHEGFACRDLAGYLDYTTPSDKGASPRRKPYTVDEIVNIVNEAYEARFGHKPSADLRLKYSPETKLLFIIGTHEAVDTAQQTIDTLPKAVRLF